MSGTGSWLQFANRMNKFKGSYFQDFADISGDVIVRNTGNVYLHAGSNMYITAGDISMNGFIYCKGVVDLSGNSLAGDGDGGGGGLTSLSTVGVKSINTVDFMTTSGYATVGNYLNVTGSTTLNGLFTANGSSTFTGQLDGSGASFNSLSVGNVELKGSIVPDTDSVYDIGSATHKIRDLYVSESSIWIGDNNKLSIDNNKIVMKRRKRGDTDIPKFISDKIGFANITQKVTHVKTFASQNALGKTNADTLSTYSVADWIRFANKKGSLGQNGFVKTNHTASDIYDLTADFNNDDTGQWTTESDGVIKYPGKIMVGNDANTMALETLGRTTLLGKVSIGGYSNSNYDLYVNGGTTIGATLKVDGTSYLANTIVSKSLTVTENTNLTGKLGVGKQADATHHLDVLGKSRVSDDAYFKKSLLIGPDVKTTTLTDNNFSGTTLYIETPLESGLYPDVSHNVVINVPNTVFRAQDRITVTNTNSLVIDATNRSILPLVTDINGDLVNTGMTNGWSLGGPGPNRFDRIHARDIHISTETINIEDSSGNKIGMSFDATTGSVNYTVVTKDTADASGETFVIKGVQTQKFSSSGGKIDPALLEFTGLTFGETFDSTLTYDFASVYTYDLKTTTYTGDGISSFTNSAGAQGLSSFLTANNIVTLLGYIPTKESVVIRVGVDDRSDGGLNGIDTVGNKIDLTNKIISTSDDDGGSMLKWTIWGSEDDLNASSTGNYLNYIELKNINMVSGTYFIAKTPGTLVYNILNQNILKNEDLVDVVNGDLFVYIDRTPGNNWTKVPVSLPSTASITTQMLANNVITPDKIAHDAVTSSKILNGAITNDKIADDSITAVKFKTGEINGSIFEDGSVDGAKISGNINVSKLVGNISGSVISDFTISTSKLLDQSVTGNKIVYMGVSGDRLKDSAITTDKIATDAVTTIKIKDGVITSTKLAVGVINNSNLLADSIITENKILSGAVTESKLASNSISTRKIQDGSISTAKLAPNSVTLDKINSSVLAGKQNTLVAGAGIAINVNSSGVPVITSTVTNDIQDYSITASKLSGDITSSFQPKLTVGTGINISNSNVITSYSTIPNNSVSSAMIQDGAITPDKLAFGITDTSSTNNTAEDGTFTGNYTEANVDSYSFENKSSYNSKISSDGLTIVSCNQYDTTPRSNTGRIIIKKRDNNLQSWSNATNTFVNCETINGFDMDSSGNTLVFLSKYGASAVIDSVNVYDLSSNTMKYSEVGIRDNKNVKLSSDGTKMAIINTRPINMGIDIYEVKAPTKPILKTIIGNSIYHTTDNLSASTITTTIPQLYKINKLVINDNTWVAVGDGSANTLVVSNDNGNTWIGKGRVFSHYGTSVFYAQGIWVAVGNDFDKTKLIARSTDDGITWVKSVTLSQGTKLYNMQANDVLYGLGAWWICGTGFELWKSLDSINWTQPIEHRASVYNVVSLSLVKDVIYSTGMSTDYRNQVIMLYLNGGVTLSTQPTIPFFGRDYGMGTFTHNSPIEKMIYAFGYYIAVGFGGGEGNYPGDDLSYGGNYAQIVYSTAHNTVPKTLKIFTGTCYDIHYDGNQLIATGEDIDPLKRIQYSTDFFNWHPIGLQQPPIERTTSIVNLNIAGKYAYSNDNGINWSVGTAGSVFNKFTKTFYSKRENLWLALGEGMFHTLASSYDGVNWTGKGKIFSVRGISIHYGNDTSGNGVWVAIGRDKDPKKNIAWSTDNGDTWNNPSEISITKPKDVLYALDRWWIAGNTNGLIWSDNGKDWVIGNKITNFGGNTDSISYSEDLHSILTVGDNPNPHFRTMVLFDQSHTTSTNSANEIRFGLGGKRGAQPIEIFGLKTDTTTTIDNNDLIMNKLCYKNGLYIVIGFGGTKETPTASQIGGCNIAINTDMVSTGWRHIRIFTGVGLDLFHDGNKWIATGEDIDPTKRIQYSSNGFDWTPLNYIIPSDIVFIVTNIFVRQNKVLYSTDYGNTWTISANKIFDNVTNKISYGNNRWVAVGEDSNNTLSISDDGINWQGLGKIFSNYGKSVLYKNGLWVAVGSDIDGRKSVQFSTDNGLNWSNTNIKIFDYGRDVSYWEDKWVVCGSTNKVHFSVDGISWGDTSNTTSTTVTQFIQLTGVKCLSEQLNNNEYQSSIWSLQDTAVERFYLHKHSEHSTLGVASASSQRVLFDRTISTETKTIVGIPFESNTYNDFATAKNITIIVGWGGTNGYALSGIYGGADICIVKRSLHSTTIDHTYRRIFTGAGLTITNDGSKWIATGEHTDPLKRIQYSTDDGVTWSPYVLPNLDVSDNIITHINHPVSNHTVYSIDNTNWNDTSNIDSILDKTNKIYYGNNKWFAVGDGSDNTIASSTDGIFWTGGGKLFSSNGNGIYYKHGIWIAVGKDIDTKKNIAWSLDNGVTWTNPNEHFMDEINDIIFAFDYWWICGSDATKIYKSLTGTDWTSSIDIPNFSLFLKSFFTTSNRLFIVPQVGSNHFQFQTFVIHQNGNIGSFQVFGNMISPNYNLICWVGNTVNKGCYANGITIFAGFGGTTVTPTESQVGGCNIAITHDYITWTYKRIFEGQAYDITYDGSKWIATGEHSDPTRRIQSSTDDGETWSPMFETIDVSNNVTTIVSSPLTSEYLYSNDNGSTWTTSNNNVFSFGTNKICSDDYNTAWVAVGDGSMNTVAISSDGIHWTGKGLIFNIRGNSVYHNNGVWVAVGQDTDANRNIAWSTDDGDTWSYPNFYMFYEGMDVVFALNRWIVCGFGNFIFWSLDGITWNGANKLHIHASQWLINKLQVSNDRVIISGRNNNHTAFFHQLYLDPGFKVQTLSFNMIPLSSGDTQHGFAELNGIVYHEGSYYVVGDVGNNTNSDENDLIIYNGQVNNNIHWATSSFTSSMNNFTNGVGKSINTDGSKLIITGESSEISKRVQYSEDNGINWNSYLPLSEQASNYVTNIITLSNTGKYAYSTDEGLNWTVNDDNVFSVSMNKIHYSKTQQIWMAVGEGSTNTVALSTDGINWTGKGMIFNIKGNSVYYTGGLWVAVGKDTDTTKNIAWSSDNGDTWNYPSETLLTIHGNDVLYAFNRWFVCGNNTSVYWSYNGITWNTTNKHTAPNISANSDVLNMLWDQHKIHLSMIDYTQTGTNFVLWNSSQIQTVLSTGASSQTISAIGGNKTVFSNDGNGNVHVSKITYGNGIYMASGSGNGNIAYTNRYTTGAWNRQDIFTGAGNDIIYDGSKWIATGEHSTLPNRIQFSNDKGITWYPSGISELDTIGDANTIIKYYSTFSPEEKVPKVSYIYKRRDAINILYQEINYDSCVYNQSISDQTMVYTDIDTTTAAKTLVIHSKSNVAAKIISVGTGAHTISYCAGDSLEFIGLGNSIFSIAGHKTHYNGDTWVAVGEGVNTIAVSEDGINWTGKGMIFGIRGKSVHYAKGMWIAVGEDNTSSRCIAYSTNNGATWSYSNSSIFSTSANDIVHTDHNGWIAVGQGTVNTLATSVNGIVWTGQGLVMDISIDSIAHGGLYHIMLGGRDSNYNRCYLYNNQHRSRNQTLLTRACPPLSEWPFNWTSIGNPHNWTRVYSVYFRDNIFGITSDGTTRQASIGAAPNTVNQTNDGGFVETWKTKGFLMLPDQTRWVYGNYNTLETNDVFKIINGSTINTTSDTPSMHTELNHVEYRDGNKKILSIPFHDKDYYVYDRVQSSFNLERYINGSWSNSAISKYRMAFSGDGNCIAVSNSERAGTISVFKINYDDYSHYEDYNVRGAGGNVWDYFYSQNHYGKDITLNYDGSILAYSYGSSTVDSDTTKIPKVVIFSREPITGLWNSIPDATLSGSDFYEYSDFIPVLTYITGFGSTLKLSADGKTLAVTSYHDTDWCGMRVFKKKSGVWLPYITEVELGPIIGNKKATIANGDVHMTDNGQIIVWNYMNSVHISTIPDSEIYTSVRLAPMSGASAYLHVGQDTNAHDSEYGIHSDWYSAVNTNGRIYAYPLSNTINHSKEFALQSRNHLSFYTGLTLSDTPSASDNNNENLRMYIDSGGLVGIGKKSTLHQLDVSGSINATNGIYSSGTILNTSDDRLKDNEMRIENAISTLMNLTPEIYDKKSTFDGSDYKKESGLIAQDIWYNTPELRHLVNLGSKIDGTKTVTENVKSPINALKDNVSSYLNEDGERIYMIAGRNITKEELDNDLSFKTIISQYQVPNIVPVVAKDIQDISLNNINIQEDPDYTALGWGDTPASVNYNGIIAYLVKAIQEQQDIINLLKTDVDTLKKA